MNDATPSLDTPAVHPTYLRLLCQTLRGQGVDVDPLIRAAGLGAWTDLAGRDALVEHRAVNSLIRECLRASGKAWLGLELGAAVQASAHGPMGYAAIASRDLGQALEVVARYVPTRNAAFRFRLRDTKDGVAFELIERIDLEDARDFITSMVFVTILRLMEAVVGQPMSAVEVDLPFPEPPWRAKIDQVFRGRVRFGGQRLVFHVNRELLSHPCMTADPVAFEQARMECERLLSAAVQSTMAKRVRELLAGREGQYPTLRDAAGFFNVSSRTLMRRLNDEGTSFQELLDAARKERARHYLSHTHIAVEEIAARLGYIDTTNFSRSFRRWFGVTPSEMRKSRARRPAIET